MKLLNYEKTKGGDCMQANNRKHTRYGNPVGLFNITTDKKNWYEIGVDDISAGGMKFSTSANFEVNDNVYAVLMLRNKIKDNMLNLNGVITRKETPYEGMNSYGLKFEGIGQNELAHISEIMYFVK